jgi:cardiolipin synthase
LFARDWMSTTSESLNALLTEPVPVPAEPGGSAVQVVASGPTYPAHAMPGVFVLLLYGARREVVITTPYYVPDESLQQALCACARRGVETTLILPARNDSRMVAAASRSYYADLLEAGVRLYEFTGGLLHAKTFVVDGIVTLFGSANMDRRSFDLNQENNVLIHDSAAAALVRARQEEYRRQSVEVPAAEVIAWPLRRKLWNNTMAMLGPLI